MNRLFFAALGAATMALWSLSQPACAATIYESATRGPTGVTWNQITSGEVPATNVKDLFFSGVRFHLDERVRTTRIGGHFVGANVGTFFGAIVSLDDANDFPDSINLNTPDVLAETLLTFPVESQDAYANLELVLQPGWYALTFGSGLFGATGRGVVLRNGIDIGSPSHIAFDPNLGWFNLDIFQTPIDNNRFVIEGVAIPEPSAAFLASLLLVGLWQCCSRRAGRGPGCRRALGRAAIFAGVILCAQSSQGAASSRDWKTPGDGLLTYDDVNRREWLDLTESRLSMFPGTTFESRYQTALLQLASGGRLEEFEAATRTDLVAFARSAGIETDRFDYSTNELPTRALVNLVSPSLFPAVGGVVSFGLLRELSGPQQSPLGARLTGELFVNPDSGPNGVAGLFVAAGAGDNLATLDNVGIWIYRDVPEPSGLLAGVMSLLCLSKRSRKRYPRLGKPGASL